MLLRLGPGVVVCALAAGVLSGPLAHVGDAQETGAVAGHVKLTRFRGAPLASATYTPRAVGRHAISSVAEIRNVVLYLKDAVYRGPLAVSRQEIRQQDETFVPRVLAVTRGSTVDFPNGDPFFHNVFSLSSAGTFDLGRYKQGESRSMKFTRAGLVKIFCHIHSHMSASIFVLDHPYFTIPNADGTFTLPPVPPGRYTLVGWHERIGERTAPVQIEAGRTVSVEMTLPVEDQP